MARRRSEASRHAGALWALVLLLTLAGCGGAQAPAAAEQGGGGAQGTRMVKHAMGETQVPASPRRVVVLDTGELDSAITLGVKPVGAVTAFQDGDFPSYLKDRTADITTVGTINQPNLETILTLKPDLILSSKRRHEAIYSQLAQVAPTVFTEDVGVVWKDNFRLHAEALGKTAEARQVLADYDRRLAEFKARMGDRLGRTEVSVIRFLPGQTRIMMKSSFIGTVLDDAGLPRPAAQNKAKFMEEGSQERIPDLDAAVMFVTTYGAVKDTALATFRGDPLWSRLNVVKEGRVYEVPDDYWMLGIGIGAANRVVDDLFAYIAK